MVRKAPQYLEGRLSRAATAGEYFEAELLEPAGLTRIEVDWPDDADLRFAQNTNGAWIISGTVHQAKLYEFIFRGTINNKDVAVNLRLPASPDPWTIWKDLPVDWTSLPYPNDDTDQAEVSGALHIIAASRRGRSHAHKALPRDDDMRIYHDEATGWHIATVADGAGSAAFSRFGSQTAVETVITELPLLLAAHMPDVPATDMGQALHATLGAVVGKASDAIDDVALSAGRRLQDFSTTLLIGIARKTDAGYFFASISVGDGLIGLIADKQPPLMMSPDNGSFAGQTAFLRKEAFADDAALRARIHHCTVPDFTAFLLMTDGVSDPMFSSELAAENPDEWTTLLDQIDRSSPDALCDWLHFKVKGEHDDRTIAIMTPSETAS